MNERPTQLGMEEGLVESFTGKITAKPLLYANHLKLHDSKGNNMSTILVLHGPTLNLLGTREPEIYGYDTLDDINQSLDDIARQAAAEISFLQSNAEHELIDAIHAARGKVDFIIINPGAFAHTSIAIRDALLAVAIPFIEVHLSNVFSRETFRHESWLSDIAVGIISGLGANSYRLALQHALTLMKSG